MRPPPKRIVVVDAESRTLVEVGHTLNARPGDWASVVVGTAAAGLLECELEAPTVLVTALSLPDGSGADLLETVARRWPATLRILTADRSAESAALRAAPAAHDFVPTPLDPGSLGAVLDAAAETAQLIHDPAIRALVGAPDALPAVPRTYLELLRLLATEGVTIDALAGVVARDASLALRVLQVANSPFFGSARSISSIDRAVAMLGSRLLKSLAMIDGAFTSAESVALPADYDLGAEQEHAIAVAAMARRLAGPARGDGAFSAGLLHDIGRLLLAVRAPDRFDEVADHARREAVPMLAAERAVLGVDHAELGAYLLSVWGLPTGIVSAVRHHHDPLAEADPRGFAVYLHLADGLIREVPAGEPAEAPPNPLHPPLFDPRVIAAPGRSDALTEWRAFVERAVAA